jgi:RNA polymerase sigma-70 factor (ECF subfamily)
MDGPPPDDRELASAFLGRKDEDAFRELFRRHTPAVHAFCVRFLGERSRLAEDVVQETWLRAATHLSGFGWRSSLRTWLIGIAANCAREARRRDSKGGPLVPGPLEPTPLEPTPDRDLDLEQALRALAAGYREVLVLHDIGGFTHPEIAELMGIEVGTSRSQLFRARRALRARWAPLGRPQEDLP